jgi:membrane protein
MQTRQEWELFSKTIQAWSDDYAPSMGAALAFYTMFSIAPLLLIIIAVAGWVFGADAARGEILAELRGLMGREGAAVVEGLIKSASEPDKGATAAIIGVVLLLVGATTVFGELQDALDRIWRAPVKVKARGFFAIFRGRLLSFGMIFGISFLLMVSLVVSAGLSALGKWWSPVFSGWEAVAQLFDFCVSFALITVLFALIYKVMPHVKVAWHDVWMGASVTALLFTIGKLLIGLYIGKSGVASVFGAAGSLAVLLLWVYYSAQIFLLGAEYTWVYAHQLGSMREASQPPPRKAVQRPSRR